MASVAFMDIQEEEKRADREFVARYWAQQKKKRKRRRRTEVELLLDQYKDWKKY